MVKLKSTHILWSTSSQGRLRTSPAAFSMIKCLNLAAKKDGEMLESPWPSSVLSKQDWRSVLSRWLPVIRLQTLSAENLFWLKYPRL